MFSTRMHRVVRVAAVPRMHWICSEMRSSATQALVQPRTPYHYRGTVLFVKMYKYRSQSACAKAFASWTAARENAQLDANPTKIDKVHFNVPLIDYFGCKLVLGHTCVCLLENWAQVLFQEPKSRCRNFVVYLNLS